LDYMEQALSLAHSAVGRVSPNPAVGAVLVKDGRVVGKGATQPSGGPHAEVMALQDASADASGATLYVTLEPCAHQGRTPPCTAALIEAGVAEVHLATLDPDPRVDGKGKAALEAAGISVTIGERAEEALRLIEAFVKRITSGLPFVTAKFAASLDGRIATSTGDSQWITSQEARKEVHRLRGEHDAVMVGIGTALADDPLLTARDLAKPPAQQPLRVVLDSRGRLPKDARMLGAPGPTLVAVAQIGPRRRRALENAGAEVAVLPDGRNRVDLTALLRLLGEREVSSILVEGGATLLGTLFDQRMVDRVVAFIAPVVIGGTRAPGAVGGNGAVTLANAMRLRDVEFQQVGEDVMVTGYPEAGR
jgi:diaminohydroxyphosphoribosylaminopyrimidine deaminase/5-amino-6-(5-phosphoribosylamino)uracil reductase